MTNKLNVLHVDDSATIRQIMLRELADHNSVNQVCSGSTIAEGMDVIKNKDIDVAVLDIGFKEGNGISLLNWIKEYFPKIIVIMFTNHADDFFKNAAIKAGAEYFLDKSYHFRSIEGILTSIQNRI